MSRFDRVVVLTLLAFALLTAVIAWRGDQIGVQVVTLTPRDGAGQVSSRAVIRIAFDQEITPMDLAPLSVSPPVSGSVRWEGKSLAFVPAGPLAEDTVYTVTLTDGLKSRQGRPLLHAPSWQFRTGGPRILYIAQEQGVAEDRSQLYVVAASGGEPVQLTKEPLGIWDYAASPDGATVAYGAIQPGGESHLWSVSTDGSERRQLLNCPQAACSGVYWFPDGRRLMYERRNLTAPDASAPSLSWRAPLGPARLWWLDLATEETGPVFQDGQRLGYGPRISPDGQWVAYVSPSDQGIQLFNLSDGRNRLIRSEMGEPAAWSPRSDAVLLIDVRPQEDGSFAVHLLRAGLEGEPPTDLTSDANAQDSAPAWSPDGTWIALARKDLAASSPTAGRQLWLMRPDGSEARQLTTETEADHGPPAWSPDGRTLLFQRYNLSAPLPQPSVWLLDVQTGEVREVVAKGGQPAWLP
jgi:TolB protein